LTQLAGAAGARHHRIMLLASLPRLCDAAFAQGQVNGMAYFLELTD
jgi:hypothetical protein